ncbi:hypothetical protein ACN27G_29860 [Plantactinospora sp. WMMB334]|uniref:hypothetical protein n=1 Tax=Plantactinospora sp. WMMB334 TaxID=3404119 RepID=UPI003B931AD4
MGLPDAARLPRTATTVAGLAPGTTYRLAVRALDEAGNVSALSNVVTVTTGPEPGCAARTQRRGVEVWTDRPGDRAAEAGFGWRARRSVRALHDQCARRLPVPSLP